MVILNAFFVLVNLLFDFVHGHVKRHLSLSVFRMSDKIVLVLGIDQNFHFGVGVFKADRHIDVRDTSSLTCP